MKRKRRRYSPWHRMRLYERYAELKFQYIKARKPKPGTLALQAVHAEEHGAVNKEESTRRLIVRGRCESILNAEGDAWFNQQLDHPKSTAFWLRRRR